MKIDPHKSNERWQFRKVDREKPSIEFVDFDSEEGQKLLEEMQEVDEE